MIVSKRSFDDERTTAARSPALCDADALIFKQVWRDGLVAGPAQTIGSIREFIALAIAGDHLTH